MNITDTDRINFLQKTNTTVIPIRFTASGLEFNVWSIGCNQFPSRTYTDLREAIDGAMLAYEENKNELD